MAPFALPTRMLMRFMPLVFVFLWSTGFIGSKLGAADAEPFTFLSIRFLIVLALLIPLRFVLRRKACSPNDRMHAVIAGGLIHGFYLGGVFWAIRQGMPAGVAALIVSLQPILTSLLSGPLLGEEISARHWLGLALGLVGALLILAPKLNATALGASGIDAATIAASFLALFALTLGTLYQKRNAARTDLIAGAVWQYAGALAIVGTGALAFETRVVHWTPKFIAALAWLSVVISIGAISLLMLLIRQNSVSRIAGLFYLVPAVTALIAYLMFGETLNGLQGTGLVMATLAVVLISAGHPPPERAPQVAPKSN